jgi:hypothetical protein
VAPDPPVLVQTIWTEADFGTMNWHDNAVHAIAWEPVDGNPGRLLLDIDYIVEWVAPQPPSRQLSFWISPATLAFDPAWDLTTEIDRTGWAFVLFLDRIIRSEPDERGTSEWTLEGDGITINLGAPGFTQYLRRPPVYHGGHFLSVEQRGGFSFDRRSYTSATPS